MDKTADTRFTIAAVERETGLSKDALRVWERRYGFPQPGRDAAGDRLYPADQVERLCLIKRLMDQGYRPGKLFAMKAEDLFELGRLSIAPEQDTAPPAEMDELAHLMAAIRQHDAMGFQQAMLQSLARHGLQHFVQQVVAPMARQVGEAWVQGSIEIFEEHLFTELTKRLLRQAIAALPSGGSRPRIVLTTVPDEQHVLGLLMAEALFALEGAQCIPLGTEMPLLEIRRAAQAHRADVVALSFSSAYPRKQVPELLGQLRSILPSEVELWAGGGGVAGAPAVAGVHALYSMDAAVLGVKRWREQCDGQAG